MGQIRPAMVGFVLARIFNCFSEEARRRAIAKFLHDRCRALSQWVRDALPGLFGSDPDNYELPSIQLLVVDKAEPFKHTPANRWLHTLDIGSPLPAYQGGPDDAFRGAPPTRLSDASSRTFTSTLQQHAPLKLDEPNQRIERVLGLGRQQIGIGISTAT